jgi:hypothetical protein
VGLGDSVALRVRKYSLNPVVGVGLSPSFAAALSFFGGDRRLAVGARPQGVTAISGVNKLPAECAALVVRTGDEKGAASPDETPCVLNLVTPVFGQQSIVSEAAETGKGAVSIEQGSRFAFAEHQRRRVGAGFVVIGLGAGENQNAPDLFNGDALE